VRGDNGPDRGGVKGSRWAVRELLVVGSVRDTWRPAGRELRGGPGGVMVSREVTPAV